MAEHVVTGRTRNDLAQFLDTPKLIRAFENLVKTVDVILPDSIDETAQNIEIAGATADMAQSLAAIAQAMASAALALASQANDGPPPNPFVAPEPDDHTGRLCALESQVAALQRLISDRYEGPTP